MIIVRSTPFALVLLAWLFTTFRAQGCSAFVSSPSRCFPSIWSSKHRRLRTASSCRHQNNKHPFPVSLRFASSTTLCRVLLTNENEMPLLSREEEEDSRNYHPVMAHRILQSYSSNLQRARRQVALLQPQYLNSNSINKQQLLKPARSLALYLETNPQALFGTTTTTTTPAADDTTTTTTTTAHLLSHACIQAIRLASSLNDYKLILRLVQAAAALNQVSNVTDASSGSLSSGGLVDPRIFGEAIRGLSHTSASTSKLKLVWQLLQPPLMNDLSSCLSRGVCWTRPAPAAPEVNAMLQALTERGKIRAALDVYRQQQSQDCCTASKNTTTPTTDAYSLSILLNGLTASMSDDPLAMKLGTRHDDDDDETVVPELLQHSPLLISMVSTCCWQWNEALLLLDELHSTTNDTDSHSRIQQYVTNPVVSAMLRLNQRAGQVFARHPTSHHAIVLVLDWMKHNHIAPDSVTCTILLSSLDSEYHVAFELMQAMQQQQQDELSRDYSSNKEQQRGWSLPRPNVYIYSAAMAVCARHKKYQQVWKLLEDLDQNPLVQPNTYVYNTVLQASIQTSSAQRRHYPDKRRVLRKQSRRWMIQRGGERLSAGFQLLERMQELHTNKGLDTAPDTVTYNTLFSSLTAVSSYLEPEHWRELEERYPQYLMMKTKKKWPKAEQAVQSLLDKMEEQGVARDETTYRHALQALQGCQVESVVRILERSFVGLGKRSLKCFNAALSVLACSGDLEGVVQVFGWMQISNATVNSQTISSLIDVLGQSGNTNTIPVLLNALQGNSTARHKLVETIDICLATVTTTTTTTPAAFALDADHYSLSISSCLLARDFESARLVLTHMRERGITPTTSSLQAMARAYALIALSSLSKKKKGTRVVSSNGQQREVKKYNVPAGAETRAHSAYSIVANIGEPSASLLSIVAKACAATGLFGEAQELLRLIHKRVLEYRSSTKNSRAAGLRLWTSPDPNELVLPDLHRTLLRSCAERGNVTFALGLCEDIQYLTRQLSWLDDNEGQLSSLALQEATNSTQLPALFLDLQRYAEIEPRNGPGMKVPEWKSLLVSASKAGHWRVCLSTLQFLRPYLEETHPSRASKGNDRKSLSRKYMRIASALNSVVTCLSNRSQDAWIVRAIDDWIEWSGRRPPLRATLTAARLLSSQERDEEVKSLLTRCLAPPASLEERKDGTTYETMLYVGVISALYKDGMYEAADEVFVSAISRGCLPFQLERQRYGIESRFTLDLHGMNVAVAHSAVRMALQQEVMLSSGSWNRTELWDKDMVIVTGRGRKSAVRMRPVLRPEVQRMLVEEFYPPLSTTSVPGNMGALRVASEDINAWFDHQRQQKGARLLSVAAVLKRLASGDRIRDALSKAAVAASGASDSKQTDDNSD